MGVEMNNEPVAWMLVTGHGTKILEKKPYCQVDYWKPLYTHPAKTLTDEEINVVSILQDAEIVPVGHEIWKTGEEFNKYKKIVLATARALRKAQENDYIKM